MKKYLILLAIPLILVGITTTIDVEAQTTITCPEGDLYICWTEPGTSNTVYKGRGEVIITQGKKQLTEN